MKQGVARGKNLDYGVMIDQQGVRYLRVGGSTAGIQVIHNDGRTVELVNMDNATVRGRYLQPVANGNILEAAKQLVKPQSASVKVSPRAAEILQQILHDKEIIAMARVAVAVKTKPAASTDNGADEAPAKSRPVLVKAGKKAAGTVKTAPVKAAKKAAVAAEPGARSAQLDELMATKVVATKKATESREGSFWAGLAKYASKPIKISDLIEKMANSEINVRSAKLSKDQDALMNSIRVRVRDAYNRLGFLASAKG